MSEERKTLSLDEMMEIEVELTKQYIENKIPFVLMPVLNERMHNMLLMQRKLIIEVAEKELEQESKGVLVA